MVTEGARKIGGRGSRIDLAYWTAVLNAMRKDPGNLTKAGAAVGGADRRTIRRLWLQGVPGTSWGSKPMRDVLEAEKTEAAAIREQSARAVEVKVSGPPTVSSMIEARRDAVATRAEEAKLLRSARANVQGLLGIVTNVTVGALALSRRIEAMLKNEDATITTGQAFLMLARTANLVQKAVYGAETVVLLERAILGDPSKRAAGEAATEADEMTPEDAIEALEHAGRLASRMRTLGLSVLHGGAQSGAPPAAAVQATPAASVAPAAATPSPKDPSHVQAPPEEPQGTSAREGSPDQGLVPPQGPPGPANGGTPPPAAS